MKRTPCTTRLTVLFLFCMLSLLFPLALRAQTTPSTVCADVPTGVGSVWQAVGIPIGTSDAPASSPETAQDEIKQIICQPYPRIKIPGLQFTSPEEIAERYVVRDPDGSVYVYIPFLGQYLAAVYRWATAAAAIIAVLVLIASGVQWMISGGGEQIAAAKKRIAGALIGLVLAVGSYVILYSINPELVQFKALRVAYVEPKELYDDGIEVTPEVHARENEGLRPWSGVGHYMEPDSNGIPTRMNSMDQCIYENFLQGLPIGAEIPTERIDNVFGIAGLRIRAINAASASAWRTVSTAIAVSPDPVVRGFVEWVRDFYQREIPDLHDDKGEGVISVNLGRVGYNKSDNPIEHFRWSMHSIGLAVDFMTKSNKDVCAASRLENCPNSKSKSARDECENILEYIDESTELQNVIGRYHFPAMNIRQRIQNCVEENLPWSSIPDEVVALFERNGFYWGGNGWGQRGDRSDSMHFEYLGPCANL